jgi:hypothetical protein
VYFPYFHSITAFFLYWTHSRTGFYIQKRINH